MFYCPKPAPDAAKQTSLFASPAGSPHTKTGRNALSADLGITPEKFAAPISE